MFFVFVFLFYKDYDKDILDVSQKNMVMLLGKKQNKILI